MSTLNKKIEGLTDYYRKQIQISTMSEVKDKAMSEFGKKTRKKVWELVEEAHVHGIILGLTEALNLVKVYRG